MCKLVSSAHLENYETFLFDLDGTLVDTKEMIYICFKEVLSRFFSIDVLEEDVYKYIGLTYRQQLEQYSGPISDELFEEVVKFHKIHQNSIAHSYIKLTPGAKELIPFLKDKGKNLAVVTNRLIESTKDYLCFLGIYDYFSFCITPNEVFRPKPDPESINLAIKRFNTTANKTIFVGDSLYDVVAGNAARVTTIFTSWNDLNYPYEEGHPTYIVNSLHELIWA